MSESEFVDRESQTLGAPRKTRFNLSRAWPQHATLPKPRENGLDLPPPVRHVLCLRTQTRHPPPSTIKVKSAVVTMTLELSTWVWHARMARAWHLGHPYASATEVSAAITIQAIVRGQASRERGVRLAAKVDGKRLLRLPPSRPSADRRPACLRPRTSTHRLSRAGQYATSIARILDEDDEEEEDRDVPEKPELTPTRSLTDLLLAAGSERYKERYQEQRGRGRPRARAPRSPRDRAAESERSETILAARHRDVSFTAEYAPAPLALSPLSPEADQTKLSPRALDKLQGPITPPTSPLVSAKYLPYHTLISRGISDRLLLIAGQAGPRARGERRGYQYDITARHQQQYQQQQQRHRQGRSAAPETLSRRGHGRGC